MPAPDTPDPVSARQELAALLADLEKHLDRLPGSIGSQVKTEINHLRTLLVEKRAPRFALVGRRGSGKSSLINAIFGEQVAEVGHATSMTGEATWRTYEGRLGLIDLLDTRGLQEGSTPEEADAAGSPEESVAAALRATAPDVVLFVIKATEADAAIDGDLDGLAKIGAAVEHAHGFAPPLFAVITHCDELEPKDVRLHEPESEDAEDIEEKLERVRKIEAHVEGKLRERGELRDAVVGAYGVSAYQSWRRDGSVRSDRRWRIGSLVDKLETELPLESKVEFARLSQIGHVQHKIAGMITQAVAVVCGGIAATPLPVADIVPLTSLQVSMVSAIGYVSGERLSLGAAKRFLAALGANVGSALAVREAARALLKLIPVAGSFVSAGVAYGSTIGIGKTAAAFYIDKLDASQLKAKFKRETDEARRSYQPPGGE